MGPQSGPQRERGRLLRRLLIGGTDGNRRLTATTGALLLVLLAAERATLIALRSLLSVHIFLGMLLIPPVALKLATTGYRFVRLLRTGGVVPARRAAGSGDAVARRTRPRCFHARALRQRRRAARHRAGGDIVLAVHKASFLVWVAAMAAHVLGYLLRVPPLLRAEFTGTARGFAVVLRQGLIAGALVLGTTLHWRRSQSPDRGWTAHGQSTGIPSGSRQRSRLPVFRGRPARVR